MGVMNCSRSNCENILCDRYSKDYGYICDDCFCELLQKPNINIESFMNTPKVTDSFELNNDSWRDHLNKIFGIPLNENYAEPE